jgi:hypothetical protein
LAEFVRIPGAAHLAIRILIVAVMKMTGCTFMQSWRVVKRRNNIALMTAADSRNEILVTVRHPGQDGSKFFRDLASHAGNKLV